jgi:hypothetical protein
MNHDRPQVFDSPEAFRQFTENLLIFRAQKDADKILPFSYDIDFGARSDEMLSQAILALRSAGETLE